MSVTKFAKCMPLFGAYEQECIFIVPFLIWCSVFPVSSEGQPFVWSRNSPKYPNSHLSFLNFLHNFDVVYVIAKTALLLILYTYKTNPSFSPCQKKLRSIGPSDFNYFNSNLWSREVMKSIKWKALSRSTKMYEYPKILESQHFIGHVSPFARVIASILFRVSSTR